MGGGCWRLLGVVCPLLLHLAASQESVSMAGQCDSIFRGFAGCLISLGESMTQNVRQQQQQQQEEGGEEGQELETICKSWDDFHSCASAVLSRCPVEAASIWESLRQESRKMQFQGNLQELCSARSRLGSPQPPGSPASETNQATLRGSAAALRPRLPALLALLALPLLLLRL
ncbi:neuritin-like protein isoform X1 [Catharus ustulatus]|uniref:neuritin-like protein isoform X1 n=2 Tax=Catharus ustulatus TaxID=91951 RepID=UPI0014095E50|nr:neuritin-like protein isoform X1 [Catharus ustulatus]